MRFGCRLEDEEEVCQFSLVIERMPEHHHKESANQNETTDTSCPDKECDEEDSDNEPETEFEKSAAYQRIHRILNEVCDGCGGERNPSCCEGGDHPKVPSISAILTLLTMDAVSIRDHPPPAKFNAEIQPFLEQRRKDWHDWVTYGKNPPARRHG